MGIIKMKLVSLCVLLLSALVSSSQGIHTIKTNINKAEPSHKLLVEITTHGFLLWASMGFLMPIGILTIRMSSTQTCGKRLKILFQIHAISQVLAVLLATAGAVLSFKNFNNSFNNNHQRIGVALYGVIWLQLLIGVFRPKRGSKRRGVWLFGHWLLGTAVPLMGVFSIYSGLQAFHEKTSRQIWLWTSLFTAQICLLCFLYLFQDKWIYIQNQGLTLGTSLDDQRQKELPMEAC